MGTQDLINYIVYKQHMKKFILPLVFAFVSTVATAQSIGRNLEDKIGIVSYTHRKSFQKDVAATLDTIKSLGITNIEISNLFGKTAAEFRKLLDERGIRCTSFGVGYGDLVNKIDEVAGNAKTLGASFVRVAWIPHEGSFTIETAKQAVSDFNAAGKVLKEKYGLSFCYHNHGYEFQPYEKGTFFDFIAAGTDPAYVNFEIDILWVHFPGADPAALIRKYGNRMKLMHVKDLKKGVKGDFSGKTDGNNDVAVGTGQIDIPAVMKAAKKAGVVYYYIEDESDHVGVQVPQSLAYLKKL
jgi:sugar phosphate isomerase/epimerase